MIGCNARVILFSLVRLLAFQTRIESMPGLSKRPGRSSARQFWFGDAKAMEKQRKGTRLLNETWKRETEGAKISQSRTTNEHQIEELEGINQESKRLCKRLSDDFRTLDSPIEGRQMVTTIVESICTKSKCSFHFVHRALELARRRGEIIDDTDEERLEWRETEGKQRLTGKVWSFWSKLEKFEASWSFQKQTSETLWFVMPCCAASGSAGRINPWSVWIRSWEVSKIGRKKATLLCPRHGFCFFVWFSAVFCESFMAQAFFQEWKETIGRPRCRLATDLHLGTPWALLGHSLDFAHHGHPAVPPRQLREAERQTEINELVQAHDIRPWIRTWTTCRYMLLHAVTCCWSPVWFFQKRF